MLRVLVWIEWISCEMLIQYDSLMVIFTINFKLQRIRTPFPSSQKSIKIKKETRKAHYSTKVLFAKNLSSFKEVTFLSSSLLSSSMAELWALASLADVSLELLLVLASEFLWVCVLLFIYRSRPMLWRADWCQVKALITSQIDDGWYFKQI